MSEKLFLLLIISTQLLFLVVDFISVFRTKPAKLPKLKLSSILFLVGIIFVYGLIQFVTLALIPKTEILLDWIRNMLPNVTLINMGVSSLPIYGWVILGIFVFYVSGFWDYAIHRFFSHHKFFFFTHEYHHVPNQLFLALPGLSVRPFVALAIFPTTVATMLMILFLLQIVGLKNLDLMPLIYTVLFVQATILAITHSDYFMKFRWMYYAFKPLALTSPQDHEIHHTVDLWGNYGNYTILWDKLFKTYIDPIKAENQNHKLGLPYDQDFLGAITAGKVKLPKKLREKFQIAKYCNIDSI